MNVIELIWLEHIEEKLWVKHHVEPNEVNEVIDVMESDPFYRRVRRGRRKGEDVHHAMRRTNAGRYLIVFFIYKLNRKAVIISARDMTNREQDDYERHKNLGS